MIEVPLSQGFTALVDDEDGPAVLAHKWCVAIGSTGIAYAMRGTRRSDGRRTTQRLHTFLTGLPFVDHVNGDGLDNRRANLRAATSAENQRNRGVPRHNRSGFKGVSLHNQSGKWQAKIKTDRKWKWLGLHETPEAAARAYDAAAIELHGEFARLNLEAS